MAAISPKLHVGFFLSVFLTTIPARSVNYIISWLRNPWIHFLIHRKDMIFLLNNLASFGKMEARLFFTFF